MTNAPYPSLTPTPATLVLREFVAHAKHTFGSSLQYVGTTSASEVASGRTRDLDILIVLRDVSETHIVHVWRVIRRLQSKYAIYMDTRIVSVQGLDGIPEINKLLLRDFLKDLHGENPFRDYVVEPTTLRALCLRRIHEQEGLIVELMPRTASDTAQLRAIARAVYDAIRAYLILDGKPCAQKQEAAREFCSRYPRFSEAERIYEAYLDPQSVIDVAEFLVDCLALVKHLRYRLQDCQLDDSVLIINTPSAVLPHPRDDYLSYDHNMPLGLVCVATYLRAGGVAVNVLDAYAENLGAIATIDRIFVNGHVPRIVGMNACSPNIHVAHCIARYLKRVRDDIVVVCGGAHPSLAAGHTLETRDVDFVVVGEGEVPLQRLVMSLFSQGVVDPRIPGILRLAETGVVGTPEHEHLDLASMPTPEFSLLPLERYFGVKRRLYIHTTRGCNFNCIYCSVPRFCGGKVRALPLETLMRQLSDLCQRYQPSEVQIVDDNFSHNKGRQIVQFCEALQAQELGLHWKCQVRADQIDDSLPPLMATAGCFEADLGIETGSSRVQEYIRKGLNLERTRTVVSHLHQSKILVKAFFMLGFPIEGFSELAETINYAIDLTDVGLDDVAFFPVMPFPGTRLAEESGVVVHQGAVIDEVDHYGRSFAAQRLRKYSARPEVSLNALFTPEALRLLVKFAYQRFQLRGRVKDLEREFSEFQYAEEEERFAT